MELANTPTSDDFGCCPKSVTLFLNERNGISIAQMIAENRCEHITNGTPRISPHQIVGRLGLCGVLAFAMIVLADEVYAAPPDVAKIAFESKRDGNSEIYIMDADGGNPVRLTKEKKEDTEPAWSPDGEWIAFMSNRAAHFEDIFIMTNTGKDVRRLTENGAQDKGPRWSPDGVSILIGSPRAAEWNYEIYLLEAEHGDVGAEPLQLTQHGDTDIEPDWSPDGKRIVWSSNRDGNFEIYVMDASGENEKRLTNDPGDDKSPAWQPKIGQKIAFSSTRDFNNEIYVMDVDGGNQTNLTNDFNWDDFPEWSPNGSKIAFSTLRDGNGEIYVMDADGGNPTNLTNTEEVFDANPAWFDPAVAFSVTASDKTTVTWGEIKRVASKL